MPFGATILLLGTCLATVVPPVQRYLFKGIHDNIVYNSKELETT